MDHSKLVVLTTQQMKAVDRLAAEAGTAGIVLMERAGLAVAEAALRRSGSEIGSAPVVILCGPGHNGGDGLVAARILRERGLAVHVGLLCDPHALTGDAALAWRSWQGPVEPVRDVLSIDAGLFIDALFGAGLNRPLDGDAAAAVQHLAQSGRPIVAVDVPSGLNGDTGLAAGPVARASETVTFFRLKPGHLLLPGRDLCGAVTLADIGISAGLLDTVGPTTFRNSPALWAGAWPVHGLASHKYTRGAVAVLAGGVAGVGAPRLSARAAMRIGAGLVTIHCDPSALAVHAARGPDALMQRALPDADALEDVLADRRLAAILAGPALGLDQRAEDLILRVARSGKPAVFDADALTVLGRSGSAIRILSGRTTTVLTPHEGEFARLFGTIPAVIAHSSKLERAREAAALSGSVVVYKGADTIIAAPNGRAAINATGTAALATAGSGDVLAGLIAGLLGQGMPAFEAAAAAVWLHGRASVDLGFGLIADDLPEAVARIVARADPRRSR